MTDYQNHCWALCPHDKHRYQTYNKGRSPSHCIATALPSEVTAPVQSGAWVLGEAVLWLYFYTSAAACFLLLSRWGDSSQEASAPRHPVLHCQYHTEPYTAVILEMPLDLHRLKTVTNGRNQESRSRIILGWRHAASEARA